jgi:plastocyanin
MKRLTLVIGMLGLTAVLAACSNAGSTPGSESAAPSAATGETVTITAKDLAFGQSAVTVPADEAFTVVLDNQEAAPHNVAIYTDESASTKISIGEIFSGPAQKSQTVPALAAGSYFFRCDVHPDMKGTITAE